ncbi:MAG: hypothetical protein LBB18_00225 [Puniceicoccales bacterium]|nr:hypothetical protein [Puniceicoccales bacterium]
MKNAMESPGATARKTAWVIFTMRPLFTGKILTKLKKCGLATRLFSHIDGTGGGSVVNQQKGGNAETVAVITEPRQEPMPQWITGDTI